MNKSFVTLTYITSTVRGDQLLVRARPALILAIIMTKLEIIGKHGHSLLAQTSGALCRQVRLNVKRDLSAVTVEASQPVV
jgi:hypothetical protein